MLHIDKVRSDAKAFHQTLKMQEIVRQCRMVKNLHLLYASSFCERHGESFITGSDNFGPVSAIGYTLQMPLKRQPPWVP